MSDSLGKLRLILKASQIDAQTWVKLCRDSNTTTNTLAKRTGQGYKTQSQMFQKVESDGGPFLKVGFKS